MAIYVIGLIFCVFALFNVNDCDTRAEAFKDVDYNMLGSCNVKYKGVWIPVDTAAVLLIEEKTQANKKEITDGE